MAGRSRRELLSLGVLGAGTALASSVLGSVAGGTAPNRTALHDGEIQEDSTAVEWKRYFRRNRHTCEAVVGTGDGVVLAGAAELGGPGWVSEVGSDGVERWSTTFTLAESTRPIDAVVDGTTYTVLATADEPEGNWVISVDTDGTETSRWRLADPAAVPDERTQSDGAAVDYGSADDSDRPEVLHRAENGYLIGGYYSREDSDDHAAWVRAVTPEGETRWNRLYEGEYVEDIARYRDGYLLAGQADDDAWLQAIDPDGTPRWQHRYGGARREEAAAIVPTDRGIVYGGYSNSGQNSERRAILVRTTADREFVWRQTHRPESVVDLQSYGDGFVMTGRPYSPELGERPDIPVLLIDRWGRLHDRVEVSVDSAYPAGLARFEDGTVALGGWDRDDVVWLAKIDLSADS